MSNDKPIGFIDSGFGGLTVVKQALKQLPNETVYFVGDSNRCPYGPRPTEEVITYTFEMVNYLLQFNIKMLVIACNTATAAALELLKSKLDIPVVGVITPGSRAAIKNSINENIGVIATQGTINSGVYEKTLMIKKPTINVFNKACPSFVEIVETNKINEPESIQIIENELAVLMDKNIDTLILGCTHYPLLKTHIQNVIGKSVKLIDSGKETINDVSMLLDYFDIAAEPQQLPKTHHFFTTGESDEFKKVASQWLNIDNINVEKINLADFEEFPKMSKKEIIIATKNIGKTKEFQQIFGEKGYVVKTLLDFPELPEIEETGTTFEENARLKAESISKILNKIVIADDSGLMVDVLNGEPGVYSARYSGEPKNDARNNAKLLAELAPFKGAERAAKFHCTIVMAIPNEASIVVSGELKGQIATVPIGENGFGYDPIFYVPELDKTTAQLSKIEKNQISHRGKAINALMNVLNDNQKL